MKKLWHFLFVAMAIIVVIQTIFVVCMINKNDVISVHEVSLGEVIDSSSIGGYMPAIGYISDAKTAAIVGNAIINDMCRSDNREILPWEEEYILFITWIFPAPNSGFIAMGCVGSFVIGIGMINIIGLVDNTYLGNTITAKIMAPGICLVVISSIVMYVPAIYSKLNEEHVTFYFLIWILLMVSILYYPFFRHAVCLDLQKKGLSKTRIKKSMEGRRNYWWYDSLKGDMSSRWIHIVNKLFTIAFLCTGIVHLLIGWWSVVFPVITIATCFLLLLNSMMGILFITTWDQTKKYRNRASPLGLVAWVGMPIIWCYALIKYYLTMLQ